MGKSRPPAGDPGCCRRLPLPERLTATAGWDPPATGCDHKPFHSACLRPSVGLPSAASCGSSSRRCRFPPCPRSEEHTSELQSHLNLVCRLLLEKKKKKIKK